MWAEVPSQASKHQKRCGLTVENGKLTEFVYTHWSAVLTIRGASHPKLAKALAPLLVGSTSGRLIVSLPAFATESELRARLEAAHVLFRPAPMHVLFVQPALPHYRVAFFERLQRQGNCRITVWSDHTSRLHVSNRNFDFAVEHRPERQLGPFVSQPALLEAVREASFDVVVLSWNTRYVHLLPALLEAKRRYKPVLVWGHGYSKNERLLRRIWRNRVGTLATACVTYSESTRANLLHQGFAPERVFCAPNALHDGPLPAIGATVSEADGGVSPKPQEQNRVLFVSRLEADKQPLFLLDAFVLVRARVPDAQLLIVGSGAERNKVERRVQALGLERAVTLLGPVYDENELRPLFLASKVFAYPTAIGLSLLHAFAYGLPVVTAMTPERHNPEFEALVPNVNGLTYADGDVVDFACQIVRLLRDEGLRTSLSQGAISSVSPPAGKTLHNMVQGMRAALDYAVRG